MKPNDIAPVTGLAEAYAYLTDRAAVTRLLSVLPGDYAAALATKYQPGVVSFDVVVEHCNARLLMSNGEHLVCYSMLNCSKRNAKRVITDFIQRNHGLYSYELFVKSVERVLHITVEKSAHSTLIQ